jgi:hypothetical protein
MIIIKGMLGTLAPGQIGTRTLRHQDKSAPGQFGTPIRQIGTCVFLSSLGSGIILESFQPEFSKPLFLQVFSS